jgi:hypothetical protein
MNILILAHRVIENSDVPGGIYSLPLCNERVLQRTIRLVCEVAPPGPGEPARAAQPVISWRWQTADLKLGVLDDPRSLIRASVLPTFVGYSHNEQAASYRGYVGWGAGRRALEVIHLNGAAGGEIPRALEAFFDHPMVSGGRTVILFGDVVYSRHAIRQILGDERGIVIATTPGHHLVGAAWDRVASYADIAETLAYIDGRAPVYLAPVHVDDWTLPLRTLDDLSKLRDADILASTEETEFLRERTGDHFHA